jgi:hypothetical protein
MIARWRGLAEALEAEGSWTEAQGTLAYDLLGTPQELRLKPLRPSPEPVNEQVEKLTGFVEGALGSLDDRERVSAEMGMGMETPRELALAQRYREASPRRVRWALKEVRRAPAPSAAARPPAGLLRAPGKITLGERLEVYRDALSVRVANAVAALPPPPAPVDSPAAAPPRRPEAADGNAPQPTARLSCRARRYLMKQQMY